MTLINARYQTRQVAAINHLINRYGHDCTITTTDFPATNTRLVFGKSKASLDAGTLINSNTYRLLVKIIPGMAAPVPAVSSVLVNGVTFFVQTVSSLGPNAAAPIVYELTCAANSVPADPNTVATPSVTSPTDNTNNYAYVSNTGALYAISVTSTALVVSSGEAVYVGADWQIATDDAFTAVVASASGVSGYTWNSGDTLSRNTNYYIRVRHNATSSSGNIVTAWCSANLFSLDTISTGPVVDIYPPTMLTTKSGFYLTGDDVHSEYDWDTSENVYKVYPTLSTFASDTGKVYAHTHWQIAFNATFTGTMLFDGNSAGGYDAFSKRTIGPYSLLMSTPFSNPLAQMYVRGKQVATDNTESDWSDTLGFYVQ